MPLTEQRMSFRPGQSVLRLFEKTSDTVKISFVFFHDRLYYRPKGIFVTKIDG